jgi:hypothetical protein
MHHDVLVDSLKNTHVHYEGVTTESSQITDVRNNVLIWFGIFILCSFLLLFCSSYLKSNHGFDKIPNYSCNNNS